MRRLGRLGVVWAWLLGRVGQPRPCDLCGRTVPVRELREVRLPGAIIFRGTVVVQSARWVCDRCPG